MIYDHRLSTTLRKMSDIMSHRTAPVSDADDDGDDDYADNDDARC